MKRIDLVATVTDEKETELSKELVELIESKGGKVKTHHVVTVKKDVEGAGAKVSDVL